MLKLIKKKHSVQQFFCCHLFSNIAVSLFVMVCLLRFSIYVLLRTLLAKNFQELYFCPGVEQEHHPECQHIARPLPIFQIEHKITVSSSTEGDKQEPCAGLSIESNRLCTTTEGSFHNFINRRSTGLTAGQFRKVTTIIFRMNLFIYFNSVLRTLLLCWINL